MDLYNPLVVLQNWIKNNEVKISLQNIEQTSPVFKDGRMMVS